MKEEPDPARPAELAKLAAKREEVEVMDPDQVAGPQEVYERGGVFPFTLRYTRKLSWLMAALLGKL